MLKAMVSALTAPLAALIASRSVHSVASQTPSPGSPVELTVKVTGGVGLGVGVGAGGGVGVGAVESKGAENSEVFPAASVTVAVTLGPATEPAKLQFPEPSATVEP